MAKILKLHRHSSKTKNGKRISTAGANLANKVGQKHYSGETVDWAFHGPLPRTLQTLSYMMFGNPAFGNPAFDNAEQHPDPIVGLGDDDLFAEMFPQACKDLIKEHGLLGAVLKFHSEETAKRFADQGIAAIGKMFSLMKHGQLAVGVFHDPTVALAAWGLGFEQVRSLSDMESITFKMNLSDEITVVGINTVD